MFHTVFTGVFFTVAVVVSATVLLAAFRAWRDYRSRRFEAIRWHTEFHDLAEADRDCRHVLTGEFRKRTCPNDFDCRRCETHAAWVVKHPPAPAAGEPDLLGIPLPLDRMYHRGHTWVRQEQDGTVTVGLDELGRRLIGRPDTVELPGEGAHLYANGTGWKMRRRNADVRVLAPVDGEVVAAGGPDQDWYLRLKPLASAFDFRHLLRGAEVHAWTMREFERLQLLLATEGVGPSLADGGVPVDDIGPGYPAADWDAVCGQMFLEP